MCVDQEVQLTVRVLALSPKKISCSILRYCPSIYIGGLSKAVTLLILLRTNPLAQ
jgi:hypothetical protein